MLVPKATNVNKRKSLLSQSLQSIVVLTNKHAITTQHGKSTTGDVQGALRDWGI